MCNFWLLLTANSGKQVNKLDTVTVYGIHVVVVFFKSLGLEILFFLVFSAILLTSNANMSRGTKVGS